MTRREVLVRGEVEIACRREGLRAVNPGDLHEVQLRIRSDGLRLTDPPSAWWLTTKGWILLVDFAEGVARLDIRFDGRDKVRVEASTQKELSRRLGVLLPRDRTRRHGGGSPSNQSADSGKDQAYWGCGLCRCPEGAHRPFPELENAGEGGMVAVRACSGCGRLEAIVEGDQDRSRLVGVFRRTALRRLVSVKGMAPEGAVALWRQRISPAPEARS